MSGSKTILIRLFTCLALLLLFSACSSITGLTHYFRSTDHFLQEPHDSRVKFEPGAEYFASLVAENLPSAESRVKEIQKASFVMDIRIYVCATQDSFKYMTGRGVKALTYRNAVFFSPSLMDHPSDIRGYLTHELSHLELLQHRGLYNFLIMPPWFTEGLAVHISEGAGAQNVSITQAQEAIAEGKRFTPEMAGGLFDFIFPHYGNHWSLEPHMFYRQAQMFVSFMQDYDKNAFNILISNLENGKDFSDSYASAYRISLSELWQIFLGDINTRKYNKTAANHGNERISTG